MSLRTLRLEGPDRALREALAAELRGAAGWQFQEESAACCVYLAGSAFSGAPDLGHARRFLEDLPETPLDRLVLVCSAAVFPPGPRHPGMAGETQIPAGRGHPVARAWRRLERLFQDRRTRSRSVTLLRCAPLVHAAGQDHLHRLLRRSWALIPPGHDPPLQLLSLDDLARAILCVLEHDPAAGGLHHIAPAGVIPLQAALRQAGVRALPLPALIRRPLAALGLGWGSEREEYLRYPWTVSGERARRELGFEARDSSLRALRRAGLAAGVPEADEPAYDDYGLDPEAIRRWGRRWFDPLEKVYWRIEYRGLEHLPETGAAVLVGIHRGLLPFDAVMLLHAARRERGRIPRFLVHPGLLKPPFFFDFITRMGGLLACRANAERMLAAGEVLGVFPEGVRGAFTRWRDARRLLRFDLSFVRLALRFGVPIVPFVTVGSADTLPVLHNFRWSWWQRRMDWPYFPLAFPFPLPVKWHTLMLPPIEAGETHSASAADDPAVVREIGRRVRSRMEDALRSMLARRLSRFRGSIFE